MAAELLTLGFLRSRSLDRSTVEKYLPWAVVLLISFATADLLILAFRHHMLPTEAPPARPRQARTSQLVDSSTYRPITDKNIFASDGVIPPVLVAKDKPAVQDGDGSAPVLSNLPLNLIGTLVHSNPEKSIATIEVKSKNTTIALRVGKSIENIAKLVRVERSRAIIINLNNQRSEYIEMKTLSKVSFSASPKSVSGPATPAGEVKQVGQNRFEINRSDILKHTADMASLLQQAAMQPRRNAQGEIECFKFIAIQPNSVFTQLGFQPGDCLKAVNGERIESPQKAMEMYNAFKTSSSIKLQLERDGRDQENDYTVR